MRSSIRKILPLVAVLALAAAPAARAAEEEGGVLSPKNFSSALAMTTDYVDRGISQTDSNPAVQGSFDYEHPIGVYTGVWASNVASNLSAGGIELDWYGGFRNTVAGLGYDVGLLYYSYPKAGDAAAELNHFELAAKLSYTIDLSPVEPTFTIGYNFSPDFFGEDGPAHWVYGQLSVALPMGLSVAGEVGYQTVEGDKTTGHGQGLDGKDGYDYVHYRFGVSKADVVGFDLDLSYHNSTEHEFLGDGRSLADGRVVFTVSRTF